MGIYLRIVENRPASTVALHLGGFEIMEVDFIKMLNNVLLKRNRYIDEDAISESQYID